MDEMTSINGKRIVVGIFLALLFVGTAFSYSYDLPDGSFDPNYWHNNTLEIDDPTCGGDADAEIGETSEEQFTYAYTSKWASCGGVHEWWSYANITQAQDDLLGSDFFIAIDYNATANVAAGGAGDWGYSNASFSLMNGLAINEIDQIGSHQAGTGLTSNTGLYYYNGTWNGTGYEIFRNGTSFFNISTAGWTNATVNVASYSNTKTSSLVAAVVYTTTRGNITEYYIDEPGGFVPTTAVYNIPTEFNGFRLNESGVSGWWWNFTYGGISYFTNNTQSTTQSLNVTGIWNVTLIVEYGGANETYSQNVSVYRYLQIDAKQEDDLNTTIGVVNASFDGNSFTTGNGTFYVDLSTQYTAPAMMEMEAIGYENRTQWINLTELAVNGTLNNVTFYLLQTSSGEDTELRLASPSNLTDYATNTLATLSFNNSTMEQVVTDGNGFVTFFMNDTRNYCVEYDDNVICNNRTVTVLIPLDEKDTSLEIKPFDISVSGAVSYIFTGLTADKTFTTYSFTEPTVIRVENGTYIGKTYYLQPSLIGSNATIQPYLLKNGDGAWNFFVLRNNGGALLPGVTANFYKEIGGNYEMVGQILTDDTGSGQIYLDPLTLYYITFNLYPYDPLQTSLSPQGTTYYITLTLSTSSDIVQNTTWIAIYPKHNVNMTDIITGYINDPTGSITSANITMTWNGSVVYTDQQTISGYGTIFSKNVSDLNITQLSYWLPLKTRLCATWSDSTERCVYKYGATGINATGLKAAIININEDFALAQSETTQRLDLVPALGALFIVLLLSINNIGLGILALLAFAIIGWVPWWLALLGIIVGLFTAVYRGEL